MRRILVAAVVVWGAGTSWVWGQDAGSATATGPSIMEAAPTGDGMPGAACNGPGCGAPGCGGDCDGCAHTDCGWVSGEYLLWYYHHAPLPPLATSATGGSTGALGQSGTTLLFDGQERNQPSSGARITLGYWLDDCKTTSVELSGFFLGWRTEPFKDASPATSALTRPYVDATTGMEAAFPVAAPGVASGDLLISNRTILYGAEANYVACLCRHRAEQLNLCGCCLCCYQLDWLFGFRYLNFQENLDVVQNTGFAANGALYPAAFAAFAPLAGDTVFLADSFDTRTQFYGPQTGFDGVVYQGNWAFELRGKLAVGASDEIANRIGETGFTGPAGAAPVMPGGFLVSPGSIGRSSRVQFAVVPEVSFNMGYRFSDRLAGYVGYNLLYWTAVARAGDQVSTTVNPAQLPLFGAPAMGRTSPNSVTTTDMWVQGLTVGVEFTW